MSIYPKRMSGLGCSKTDDFPHRPPLASPAGAVRNLPAVVAARPVRPAVRTHLPRLLTFQRFLGPSLSDAVPDEAGLLHFNANEVRTERLLLETGDRSVSARRVQADHRPTNGAQSCAVSTAAVRRRSRQGLDPRSHGAKGSPCGVRGHQAPHRGHFRFKNRGYRLGGVTHLRLRHYAIYGNK